MKKKLIIYLGFFTVLITVFLGFVFWDNDFSKSKLKVINANIPEFSFKDQNGKPFTKNNVEGKVYVAEYFFTTCKGICPKMNLNMRRVYEAYKNEPGFLIASHTCMPETDSIPVLKKYEAKMLGRVLTQNQNGSYKIIEQDSLISYSNKNWYFLTGNKTLLYNLARQGYIIDNNHPDSTQNISDQFLHSQFFALVDKNNRVRGIYDGLENREIVKLIDDIKDLLKEKVTTKRFMDGFNNNPE